MAFTLGIDCGTNSVRALLVEVSNGRELATRVVDYPIGKAIYNQLYALYRQRHDAFGGIIKCADLSGVMKELIDIKEEQTR